MSITPEGQVKKEIDKLLAMYTFVWVWKPVVTTMGKPALDYVVCVQGQLLMIEAKAEGGWLTPRQRQTTRDLLLAGADVFCVSGPDGLDALRRYLDRRVKPQKKSPP
jgi:hypothetical protein